MRSATDWKTYLADLRASSAAIRALVPAPSSLPGEIAILAWQDADQLADAIVILADRSDSLPEAIGPLARMLWEGRVTIGYVAQRPDQRSEQVMFEALKATRAIRKAKRLAEITSTHPAISEEAFLQQRESQEKAYCEARREAKKRGDKLDPFDYNKYAGLPSVEVRAESLDMHDQYEVEYRSESRCVHWVPRNAIPSEHRLIQVLVLAAVSYFGMIEQLAKLAGIPEHAISLPALPECGAP